MRERFKILAAFGASLLAVCAFFALAMVLGSLTGCAPTGDPDVTPSPPSDAFLEPSGQPTADQTLEPQLSADPAPAQSTPAYETVTQPPAPATPAPAAQPSAQPSQSSSENKLYAVLKGNMTFYSTDTAQNLSIRELGRAVSGDSGVTAKVLKYATIDLDGSGVPEVILWLQVNENASFGFEILRQKSGQVYGYTLPYQSFMDPKQDGTFSFSGGAADSGFGTLSFSDAAYTINEITYSQSAYDANNELTVSYCVNGQAASEAKFLAAVEKQNGKENLPWYDFTDENLASGIALWRNFS